MSFWGDQSDNEGLVLSGMCSSTSLGWFTIRSPLTHHSQSLLVVNVSLVVPLRLPCCLVPWAPNSGSRSSNHTVLLIKEKDPKKWIRPELSWAVWAPCGHYFSRSLSKHWQIPNSSNAKSISILATDYKTSHLKCTSEHPCRPCSAGSTNSSGARLSQQINHLLTGADTLGSCVR